MYKIPLDVNVEKFNGSVIEQISFRSNVISIFFENIGFVTTEGGFIFSNGTDVLEVTELYPLQKDWGLLTLVGKKVANIAINNERTILTFYFEKNISLSLLSNPHYESFTIFIENKRIII